MKLISACLILFLCLGRTAVAEAFDYAIITDQSMVGFTYQFGDDEVIGQFIDYSAAISIDFERAANSIVNVTLNTDTAKAGFIFATQALRSKKVLYSAQYPDIKFVSKSVKASGPNATITGLVTVRGITKPLILNARLFRDPGTKSSERDNLRIRITGALNRHDFGASGYPNDVGAILAIKINARIKRQ